MLKFWSDYTVYSGRVDQRNAANCPRSRSGPVVVGGGGGTLLVVFGQEGRGMMMNLLTRLAALRTAGPVAWPRILSPQPLLYGMRFSSTPQPKVVRHYVYGIGVEMSRVQGFKPTVLRNCNRAPPF